MNYILLKVNKLFSGLNQDYYVKAHQCTTSKSKVPRRCTSTTSNRRRGSHWRPVRRHWLPRQPPGRRRALQSHHFPGNHTLKSQEPQCLC